MIGANGGLCALVSPKTVTLFGVNGGRVACVSYLPPKLSR